MQVLVAGWSCSWELGPQLPPSKLQGIEALDLDGITTSLASQGCPRAAQVVLLDANNLLDDNCILGLKEGHDLFLQSLWLQAS